MGCVHSRRITDHGAEVLMRNEPEVLPEILQLAELVKSGSHTFTKKTFKKDRVCDVCQQDIINPGSFCKECKVSVHKMCEAKVSPTCALIPYQHTSIKSASLRKRSSVRRSRTEEQVKENVMERHYDFDLTYITERIISVFFLPELKEEQYQRNIQEVTSMLKSKHQDKFLLLNVSEKRHDITRLNHKVQDFGWPDLHAPPLDRICSVCKAMESWLSSDPLNVVVLHCKGHRGRTGVIVAAYMHYSKISAGADQALTTLAMRKFCEDKVTASLQPSQNRYIYYFDGLLSGTIKMNSSPLFLHQIFIPSLPNFQPGGGFYPFVKIYQSLQLVYTSGLYDPQTSRARKLCVTMEPALLLKGDIMVKCYHRRSQAAEREVVFRVQFHTCTVHGAQLWFGKAELDVASTDDRFPPDASVEFIFSNGPEKTRGQEQRKADVSVKVNYNTLDPVVRWDSYENINLEHQDTIESISHTRGPLDGSLYAQVRKRRGPGSTSSAASSNGCLTSSPTVTTLVSSKTQSIIYTSDSLPSDRLDDHSSAGKERTKSPFRREENDSKAKEKERETEILEDSDPSSPGGIRRGPSCCGRPGTKCADMKWEREPELCLSNSHCLGRCGSIKKQAKSQTLPAIPTKSVSPPPHPDLCHRHSSHPLPELPWERPPMPLPCLHRSCLPYSSPEHIHAHTHTLPTINRLCPGEECHLLHYSNHGPSSHLSQPSLPTRPYRELFFGSHTTSSGCACRECRSRREQQSARSFQPPHPDQQTGLQRTREAVPLWESENPWDVPRESEFWQCKPAMPSFCICHPNIVDPALHLEQSRLSIGPPQRYPSPQSLIDVRDGASSGYHTPPPPRHSCPCTPYTVSPVESHESRGYASGYQSGSASPLPASSPSPDRGRLPDISPGARDPKYTESNEVEKAKTFQGSENKSDSNNRSSSLGLDTDPDYTLIGGNSPTHTEESVTPDLQEHPETSASIESQSSNISTSSTQPTKQDSDDAADTKDQPTVSNNSDQQSSTPTIVTPVQVQLNGSTILVDSPTESSKAEASTSLSSSPSTASLNSPIDSPDPPPSPQCHTSNTDLTGQRLSLSRDNTPDNKPPSPVPDGYCTPTFPLASYYYPLLNVPHVPYTGYTAVTIPAIQPPLPEKKRLSSSPGVLNGHASVCRIASAPSPTHHVTFSTSVREQRRGSAQSFCREEGDTRVNAKFVQDSSKFWYKPGISRDQAIAVLKDKDPGSFLIRDSNSFQGAYGLALKVATPPPNANITTTKGDPLEHLVRHFLIETGPRGVKIKGCQNESYFGSLSALVYQHSITPISLPCALRIPEKDLVGELQDIQTATSTSTAADLLKQGAACNVLYLNSVETESLTGPEAVSKATKCTVALNPRPVATVVHFKVSSQGITLTDSKRRLFFRRHYPISSVTFSSLDPQDKRWSDNTSSKMFGFVARRTGCTTENVCHLFAEIDPEQPAVAIVNFINKVMLGPQLRR